MNSLDFSKTLDLLYSLERLGIKMGLEHTEQLLDSMGNPHKRLKFIHIAGTNGKGSTSAHIESVLRSVGKKVGVYTSPHLIKFNERIKVNGISITDLAINLFLEKNWASITKINSTFFETTTAMAFDFFYTKEVDIAIIETGLGGRLDSTNIIKPILSVITSVSMDHMEVLGKTLEEISFEKAGIIKEGIPLITSKQSEKVNKVLSEKIKGKNTKIIFSKDPVEIKIDSFGTSFIIENNPFKTSLLGKHQAYNASLAITVLKEFDSKLTDEEINNGFSKLFWPGRLQKLAPNIYYDVAHNQDGLKVLFDFMQENHKTEKVYGLFCLKGDKDMALICNTLSNKFSSLSVTRDKNNLLIDEDKLSEELIKNGIENKPLISVKIGISKIKELIKEDGVGVIFGSHYIAEEVYREFEISFDNGII